MIRTPDISYVPLCLRASPGPHGYRRSWEEETCPHWRNGGFTKGTHRPQPSFLLSGALIHIWAMSLVRQTGQGSAHGPAHGSPHIKTHRPLITWVGKSQLSLSTRPAVLKLTFLSPRLVSLTCPIMQNQAESLFQAGVTC